MTLNIQHCEKGLLLKYLILLERLRVSNINHSMKYDVWMCVCVYEIWYLKNTVGRLEYHSPGNCKHQREHHLQEHCPNEPENIKWNTNQSYFSCCLNKVHKKLLLKQPAKISVAQKQIQCWCHLSMESWQSVVFMSRYDTWHNPHLIKCNTR